MNKLTKYLLRLWISATSVAAFAIGWAALAHAPKPASLDLEPVSLSSSVDLPSLDPLPSLEELILSPGGASVAQPNFVINLPRLRARGS